MNICLFCSSRTDVGAHFHEAADRLAEIVAGRGDTLYYGGGGVGLMGTAALATHRYGGRIVGVIPEKLLEREVAYKEADELIVTKGMSDRKQILIDIADAFVVLAGGFGTLDELLDAMTTKQLGYHDKPIILVNTAGFFDAQLKMFDDIVAGQFADPAEGRLYHVVDDVEEIVSFL